MKAGIPVKTAYVAEGAERDDRLRDIFKLAAEHAHPAAARSPAPSWTG